MKFYYLLMLLGLAAATSNVCTQGVYGALLPLSNYAPAQSYCSAKYPPKVVTVIGHVKRVRSKSEWEPATRG